MCYRLVDMSTNPCMEMKVGLLKGTVDEAVVGVGVEEEEVEEVPSWPPKECPLDCIQMQKRRQVRSVWGDRKVL